MTAELDLMFLEEFMADLSLSVHEFADTSVGQDQAELLYRLQQ